MKKLGILLLACITALNLWADEKFVIGKFTFEIETPTTVGLTDADEDITKVFLSETIDYKGNSYTITSIGWRALEGCTSLTSVTIPNSVTSIGEGAFGGCSSLTSMVVASGNSTYDSRDNCNAIIKTATNTLIAGCQNTTIPNSVTSIGGSAFYYCSSLTSVTIPNSVTSIGDFAFEGCESLTSVTIPNSVTWIGYGAFYDCSALTSITIPNSVHNIGEYAFWGCESLTTLTILNSKTSIGWDAFPWYTEIIRK